jgi:hypothetical protein
MRSVQKLLCYFGLFAPIWMLVSVSYSGMIYPGYSHTDRAMSELHATGSPIEQIAPLLVTTPYLFSSLDLASSS